MADGDCRVQAHVLEDEGTLGAAGSPVFSPPLYKQRYSAVLNIARTLQPKKVCVG